MLSHSSYHRNDNEHQKRNQSLTIIKLTEQQDQTETT